MLCQSKWTETLSAASFNAAVPSDWFGRQLLAVTPELFDEAILKSTCTEALFLCPSQALSLRSNTETLLHSNIGLAIARTFARPEPHFRKYLLVVSINASRPRRARGEGFE